MTRSVFGLSTLKECANKAQGCRTRHTLGNFHAAKRMCALWGRGVDARSQRFAPKVPRVWRVRQPWALLAHSFRVPRPKTLRVIITQGAPSTATLGFVGALLQSAQTEDAARHYHPGLPYSAHPGIFANPGRPLKSENCS